MPKYHDCLNFLLSEADNKGYLTFDDIMNTTDNYGLSLPEIDRISEDIGFKGVMVYEIEPSEQSDVFLKDRSRVDYERIFEEIVEICPDLNGLINVVRDIPPPQFKEVSLLTSQNAEGNKYARERLILIHLRVALKIALSMSKQYELDIAEAVSSGITGLIAATDKYDPNGFSAFQSYASMWIQQHIQRDCSPKWFEFYFPAHYKSSMISIKQKYEEIYGSVDFGMNEKDIASFSKEMSKSLELNESQIMQYLYNIRNQKFDHYYLDEIMCSVGEDSIIYSIVDKNITPEEYMNKCCLKEEINYQLKLLTEREEAVIMYRFGLKDGKEYTLDEIGKFYNITRERIRQIEAKAIRKLQNPYHLYRLKHFL